MRADFGTKKKKYIFEVVVEKCRGLKSACTSLMGPSPATSVEEMAIFHAENASFDLSLDGFPL